MHEDERISKFLPLMQSLYGAARENLGFKPHAKICIVKSGKNMQNPLGKTAYYSPTEHKIGLYTRGRHIKDILRSLSHELVHHNQNCRGDFEHSGETVEGYAQEDGHLREMEREAYEQGNMIFRDWEDNLKDKGGKPLFTSTSQYVPAPTSDVGGGQLFEGNQMNERINEEEESLWGKAKSAVGISKPIPKQRTKDYRAKKHSQQQLAIITKIYDKKAAAELQAIRKELTPQVRQNPQSCSQYNVKIKNWANKYKIKEQHSRPFIAKCGASGAKEDKYTFGSKTWGALQRAMTEDQETKTTNSLFEGDEMNKKLKESQLRTIVQGLIREMFNEDYIDDANKDEEAYGAEIEAEKSGGQPGAIYKGSLEEDEDETKENKKMSKRKLKETTKKILEDSGEEEGWDDWKNEHEDDNHIEEIEHHLRALKGDRDYERKGAEYDHDKYEDEGDDDRRDEDLQATKGHFSNTMRDPETETHVDYGEGELEEGFLDEKFVVESFFPKGRDIRQKARNELNEALMKRWTKIIK